MRAAVGSPLRALGRLLSFVVVLIFCDLLLRFAFIFLFFLLLPLVVAYEQLLPALLALLLSAVPLADSFLNKLLPALASFLLALFLPFLIFLCVTQLLVPLGRQLLALTC